MKKSDKPNPYANSSKPGECDWVSRPLCLLDMTSTAKPLKNHTVLAYLNALFIVFAVTLDVVSLTRPSRSPVTFVHYLFACEVVIS